MGRRTAAKNFLKKVFGESLYREFRDAYRNARYGEYKRNGRVTGDLNHEARLAMYDEAEGILASEAAAVFLWHVKTYQLRKPWLKGFREDRWGNFPNYRNANTYYDLYIGQEAVDSGRRIDY